MYKSVKELPLIFYADNWFHILTWLWLNNFNLFDAK